MEDTDRQSNGRTVAVASAFLTYHSKWLVELSGVCVKAD